MPLELRKERNLQDAFVLLVVIYLQELSSVGDTVDAKRKWSFTKSNIIEAFDVEICFMIDQIVYRVAFCLFHVYLRLFGNIFEFKSLSIMLFD